MSILEHLNGQVLNAHEKADACLAHLADQSDLLARIAEQTEADSNRQTYQRIPFVGTADAAGLVRVVLQVPQSIGWDLVSFAVIGTAAGNASLFLGNEDGTGLILTQAIPAAPFRMSYIFAGEESVPSGQQVTILIETQVVAQDVRGNLKVNILPEASARMRN